MVYVFTSAAINYSKKVSVLFESVKKHSPTVKTCWLVIDKKTKENYEYAKKMVDHVIFVEDIPECADKKWIFSHDIVELSTAVKPFAADYILKMAGVTGVVYYDPDIVLFSNVDEIYSKLKSYNILLTPHLTKPEDSLEGVLDNEMSALKHGIFNLGFFGIKGSPEGFRFLAWWKDRLFKFCRADIANGLFTDQKWIDFAPAFFDGVEILKSSRFNVASWNVTMRKVSGDITNGILVDGEPLGFYHFTGFDSGAHELMINKYQPNNKSISQMISWYKEQSNKVVLDLSTQWSFGLYDNGQTIPKKHRVIYRDNLDLQNKFPNPYVAGTEASLFSELNKG